jgi:hypothetical protein
VVVGFGHPLPGADGLGDDAKAAELAALSAAADSAVSWWLGAKLPGVSVAGKRRLPAFGLLASGEPFMALWRRMPRASLAYLRQECPGGRLSLAHEAAWCGQSGHQDWCLLLRPPRRQGDFVLAVDAFEQRHLVGPPYMQPALVWLALAAAGLELDATGVTSVQDPHVGLPMAGLYQVNVRSADGHPLPRDVPIFDIDR